MCVVLTAGLVFGEDIQPPPWRGEWSTTSQVWEFGAGTQAAVDIAPDGPAAGGMPPLPGTRLIWSPGPPPWDLWMQEDRPFEYELGKWVGIGVIPLSGQIDVTVANHEPPNIVKLVSVQITWRPQDEGEIPEFVFFDPEPTGYPTGVEVALGDPLDPLHWRETTFLWEIRPNPAWERFIIAGTINVDELVVDTWCVPEPTTLVLLGLGGLVALRRRRS